ncbi:MAG: hypothetical protein RMJ04_08190 [Geminicoccaceae bacterium]|nr:hypothetical protein [Geminicoccaceae bacterium]
MSDRFDTWYRDPSDPHRLSGRVIGQLGSFEQFLLWALRRRVADGGRTSAVLVHGFRLAFGLAYLEPALAAFEAFCDCLERRGVRDFGLLPLRCPCVSTDEERLLELVFSVRRGKAEALARALVADAAPELLARARELGAFRWRAELSREDAGFG